MTLKRLDELFQELNDLPEQKNTLRRLREIPCFEYYLKEAWAFFDWVNFPIETIEGIEARTSKKQIKEKNQYEIWGGHWSLAPSRLLNASSIKMLDTVIKNTDYPTELRMKNLINMLEYLCKEEAEVLLLILTKNISSKYPNISSEVIYDFFPALEIKPE